jgi:hypothetical protein
MNGPIYIMLIITELSTKAIPLEFWRYLVFHRLHTSHCNVITKTPVIKVCSFFPKVQAGVAQSVQWLGYGLDDRVWFQARAGILFFATAFRPALGPTQPPIQWVPGALSLGVKRPRREADHSSTSIAEVKNARTYTSTPPYVFMAWDLDKHREYSPSPILCGFAKRGLRTDNSKTIGVILSRTANGTALCH